MGLFPKSYRPIKRSGRVVPDCPDSYREDGGLAPKGCQWQKPFYRKVPGVELLKLKKFLNNIEEWQSGRMRRS